VVARIKEIGITMKDSLNLLGIRKIKRHIGSTQLAKIGKINIFDSLDSTNDYLVGEYGIGLKDQGLGICFCLAEQQTAGRGRLGREWISPFGANIYLSALWQYKNDMNELSGLSLAIAVIIADVLFKLGIENGVGLKWPNDVFYEDKKLAGVLIDLFGEVDGAGKAVIGIGLNVNMPQDWAKKIGQPWIDLKEILGAVVDRNKITGILIDQLTQGLALYNEQGFSAFIEKWQQLDILANKQVTIKLHNKTTKGIAKGINKNGHFLLENKNDKIQVFTAGNISVD
jgi:BirA family transcriptional regulator, biotin operon repressor / biotin---[acetyl-CoA-carboxylase] ligase